MAQLKSVVDPADGLPALVVGGARAEQKHYFLSYYASMMSQMKMYDRRAYVELFAGPGRVQYAETGTFADGSPLAALKYPFTEFVYVEVRDQFVSALNDRCASLESERPVRVLGGDCNERIAEVVPLLPPGGLTLAFIDPTNWQISFDTVRRLTAVSRIDLIVSMFLGSLKRVPRGSRPDVDAFFGTHRWRMPPYVRADGSLTLDGMMRCYREQLATLGFLNRAGAREITIRTSTGAPLYLLGFFSRHELGYRLWNEATKRDPSGQMIFQLE